MCISESPSLDVLGRGFARDRELVVVEDLAHDFLELDLEISHRLSFLERRLSAASSRR